MPTNVATARIIITGDNSQALQAIQAARAAALKQLSDLKATPTFTGLQATLKAQLKQAQAGLQVQIAAALKPLTQAQVNAAASGLKASVQMEVKKPAQSQVNAAAAGLSVPVDAKIRKVTQSALNTAAAGAVANITLAVKKPAQAQLNAALNGLSASLKLTLKPVTQAQVDSALRGLAPKKTVTVDLKGDILARVAEIKTKLAELKTTTTDALKIDVTAVERVITLLKQQVVELNRVENNLRTLRLNTGGGSGGGAGGGSPGGSAASNPYLAQLKAWQTELRAGTASTAQFDAGLRTLQATLQTDLAVLRSLGTLTAEDGAKMNQMKAALAGVNAEINRNDIAKLRGDLAGARTAFEQAIGAAGRFNFAGQRAATQAYEAELTRLTARIRAMGSQAGLTQAELRSLNQVQAQLASQRNAINGVFSQVGLAGNVVNALKSLPQLAMQAGGSLGAMASTGVQLEGVLTQIMGIGGPVAAAIAGIGIAAFGLIKGFEDAVSHAAQFQKQLQQISGLAELRGPELGKYADYVQDLSTKLPITTEHLTEFGRQAVLVGLHGPEGVKTFTQGMAELNTILRDVHANAGGLEETGAEIVKVLRSMGMGTEEVNANFGKTINSLVALKTQFGVQIPEVTALATYFSSYAAKIGLTTDQILAFSASLVSVGARAQGSGSQLTKFFEKAAAAVAQGGAPLREFAKDLGLSEEATKNLLKTNPTEFLQRFAERLNVLHEQGIDSSIVLKGLGLDTNQAARTFNELAVASANTGRALTIAKKGFEDAGLSSRVAEETAKNYIDQMKEVKNAWDGIKANLGAFALPALSRMAADLKRVSDSLLRLSQEAKNGGPAMDDLRVKAEILAFAITGIGLAIKRVAIQSMITDLRTAFGLLGGWPGLASQIGRAFGTAGTVIRAAFTAAGAGGLAASAILVGVVAAVAVLAYRINQIISDTNRTLDAAEQADIQSRNTYMAKVNELIAKHTALGNAQAKLLLLEDQLREAQAAGNDPRRVEELTRKVDLQRDTVTNLARAEAARAAAEKTNQSGIQAGLKLTDDQLKKQASTIKELRDALAKPLKMFGGTEFQNQIDQIGEKYRELREKLYANVKDPKQLAPLKAALAQRQNQETANTRNEYGSKASDAAGEAERTAQRARVAAMAEGSAKIRAQARLDTDEVRRQVAEQVKAYRDFPDQVARFRKAGAVQIAQIEAQANRQAAEADKKAKDERVRQLQTVQNLLNLNAKFKLQLDLGKVTPDSLQLYQQAVEKLRSELDKLPKDQQARFTAMLGDAGAMQKQGQALVKLREQIKGVADRVKDMTVAELEAARARWAGVPAAQALLKAIDSELPRQRASEYKASVTSLTGAIGEMSDAELASRLASEKASDTQGKRVKAIEGEISARQKLRDATLLTGRLELQKNDAQAVVDNYEARKTAAQGNAQELLRIEQESGAEVLAARQRLAQVDAETAVVQAREKFGKLIEDARKHGQDTVSLENQLATAIQQIRAHRDAVQLQNKIASDKALTDQTKTTTDELVKLELDRQERLRGIDDQHDQRTVATYEYNNASATSGGVENLSERLANERAMGQQVVSVRQDMAQRAADAEIRAQQDKYRQLKADAKGNQTEIDRLDGELAQWIIDRQELLKTEQGRIYFEGAQARIAAENAVKDAILGMQRDLLDGLNQRAQSEAQRRQQQSESDLQQELRSVGDNEEAKLAVYQRTQANREKLARDGINARMKGERQAEETRWENFKLSAQYTAADEKLREKLRQDHMARLKEIETQGEFEKGQAVIQIRNQTADQQQKVWEESAQKQVKSLTKNLSEMTSGQRQQTQAGLQHWLDYFTRVAGASSAAVKQIQAALDNLADTDKTAREKAVKTINDLYTDKNNRPLNIGTVKSTLAARTNKIGKPDTRQDAVDKGAGAYTEEINRLKKELEDAQKSVEDLLGAPGKVLNIAEQQAVERGRAIVSTVKAQLAATGQAAAEAGKQAEDAFDKGLSDELAKAQDSAADAALQLVEANHKLAQAQGIDDTATYTKGLQAYRDYWQGRIAIAQQGVNDARAAEATARAKLATVPADPNSTAAQREAAQTAVTQATAETTRAVGELAQADTNYANGVKTVLDVDQQRIQSDRTLRGLRDGLNAVLGKSAPLYQSEIDQLEDLIKTDAKHSLQLTEILDKYKELQKIRSHGTSVDTIKLDFQIGVQQGQQKLNDTISQTVQSIGQLATPAGLAAVVLEKLNIAGSLLEGLFSAIEEPIQMLQEPLKLIGEMVGSLIAANLRTLIPIITAIVNVLTFFYDAIANLVYTISFHSLDIRRRETEKKKDPAAENKSKDDLRKQQLDNEFGRLELNYQKGLIDKADYEAKKLALTKKRIEAERKAELDALKEKHKDDGDPKLKKELADGEAALARFESMGMKGSEVYNKLSEAVEQLRARYMATIQGSNEEVAAINEKYDQEYEKAQLDAEKAQLDAQKAISERRAALAKLIGDNEVAELERQLRAGEITRQQYNERALELLRARLKREEAEEVAAAEGDQEKIAAIHEQYRLRLVEEEDKLQAQLAEQAREILSAQGENELADLERRYRQKLISEKDYESEKLRLTTERLNRERDAEIRAAEGDQEKILQINRKYDGQILDAKLDMLERLSAAYRQIGDTLMSSITGSIKDGLLNALKQGNFGAFRQQFRQNMRQAMFDAVLSAAIETAAMKGILQPAIDALTAAFQTDDKADDNAAIRGLLLAGSKVEGKMRQIYTAMKPLRDAWGITGDQNSEQTMTVTGQIDKPEVRISLDALGMLAGVINTNIPAFTTALTADAAALGLHTPALAANTAALPGFVSAIDQFGIHEAAYQQHVTSFGGYVGQFGSFVREFGGHVQQFGKNASTYNPQAKR